MMRACEATRLVAVAAGAVLQAAHVPGAAFLAEPLAAPAPPQRLGHAVGEEADDALPPRPGLHGILPRRVGETERRPCGFEPDRLARPRGYEKRMRLARVGECDAAGSRVDNGVEHGEEHLRARELIGERLLEPAQHFRRW